MVASGVCGVLVFRSSNFLYIFRLVGGRIQEEGNLWWEDEVAMLLGVFACKVRLLKHAEISLVDWVL